MRAQLYKYTTIPNLSLYAPMKIEAGEKLENVRKIENVDSNRLIFVDILYQYRSKCAFRILHYLITAYL